MPSIDAVVLEVDDAAAAEAFYASTFGLGPRLAVRPSRAQSTGFPAPPESRVGHRRFHNTLTPCQRTVPSAATT
jgi:catechol 2,3-dioxygenase-like lactoylglutathione lyase family enzyme